MISHRSKVVIAVVNAILLILFFYFTPSLDVAGISDNDIVFTK